MWVISGSIKIGAAFGIAELIYKPIQYYIHERVWYRWITFGLIKSIPVKEKTKRVFKKTYHTPPLQEPRVIKEEEQPTPEIKRLTYSKKSDN
jgi:uncharacterized membrane protein